MGGKIYCIIVDDETSLVYIVVGEISPCIIACGAKQQYNFCVGEKKNARINCR